MAPRQRVQSEQEVKRPKPAGALRVEVIADNSRTWAGNSLRFNTIDQAQAYGQDLFSRWTSVRNFRVIDEQGTVHFIYRGEI